MVIFGDPASLFRDSEHRRTRQRGDSNCSRARARLRANQM